MGVSESTQPRPEYPRMQFRRENSWRNLNGVWSCAFDFGRSGLERGWQQEKNGFDREILVPFCPESCLSGIGHTDFIEAMAYHRKLAVPAEWAGKRILLHFGAVDYNAIIFLDGNEAGRHSGGSSSFTVDLTGVARPGEEQNLVVYVTDFLRSGTQGGGKQSDQLLSHGCFYTRTTGIWQTVWMEAVAPGGLASCRIVPSFDSGEFAFTPVFFREERGKRLAVEISAEGRSVARREVPAVSGVPFRVAVPDFRAWCPEDPFLYDIVLEVSDDAGHLVDRVESYAGMRKVHIEGDQVFLNNRPIFQRLVLDQGFYPDGIWTAPSDEALRRDIELSLAAGFNGARLHQKVFEERFHYWADRLGYLTWGEYPSWGMKIALPETRALYAREWREVVLRDCNHPSIIAWSPFNESVHPGEAQLRAAFSEPGSLERYRAFVTDTYEMTRELDPTRPVNDTSGYLHVKTDLWTVHPYRKDAADLAASIRPETGGVMIHVPQLEAAAYTGQPYLIDEFGGFRYIPPERRSTTGAGWGYHGIEIQSAEELAAKIAEQVKVMEEDPGIAGFCYTQLTDVEQEQNGVYNYDRTPKGPAELFRKAFRGNGR